jgi:hypothetical protein
MAKSRSSALPRIEGSDRAARTFYLLGVKGEKLFPVRMKDLKTGRVAFRLTEPGSGNNVRGKVIEIEDEATAYQMVASGKYLIRAQREGDRGPGFYRLGGRAIQEIVLLDDPS